MIAACKRAAIFSKKTDYKGRVPHKITVSFIRPGATYTELITPMYADSVFRALYERVPMREIAQASWIACDESRYMTGQDLTIDGGYAVDGSLPGAVYRDDLG